MTWRSTARTACTPCPRASGSLRRSARRGSVALLGVMLALGPLFWVGWLVVVALLVYEHSLVSPGDLSRLDVAFFNVNGYIAVIVLASVVGGLWW